MSVIKDVRKDLSQQTASDLMPGDMSGLEPSLMEPVRITAGKGFGDGSKEDHSQLGERYADSLDDMSFSDLFLEKEMEKIFSDEMPKGDENSELFRQQEEEKSRRDTEVLEADEEELSIPNMLKEEYDKARELGNEETAAKEDVFEELLPDSSKFSEELSAKLQEEAAVPEVEKQSEQADTAKEKPKKDVMDGQLSLRELFPELAQAGEAGILAETTEPEQKEAVLEEMLKASTEEVEGFDGNLLPEENLEAMEEAPSDSIKTDVFETDEKEAELEEPVDIKEGEEAKASELPEEKEIELEMPVDSSGEEIKKLSAVEESVSVPDSENIQEMEPQQAMEEPVSMPADFEGQEPSEIMEETAGQAVDESRIDADGAEAVEQSGETAGRIEENEESSKMEMKEQNTELEEKQPSDIVTVITKGTRIDGSIYTDGSLEIQGVVGGNATCLGKLSIFGKVLGDAEGSEIFINETRLNGGIKSSSTVKIGVGTVVVGNITGTSAVIAGAVRGDIDVNGPVIIDSTAVVQGNIIAKSIQVNNGAIIEGQCSLSYASVNINEFFEEEDK